MRLTPTTLPVLLALAGCAAPGVVVEPAPSDFAFVEVDLRG